jgi:hypothetical protein
MDGKLQPKVASCQQLIVGRRSHNLQPVVANTRDGAKAAFSEKLHMALDRVKFAGGRERTRALATELDVSYEAARKWLGGEAIPDQTNMLRICATLHIDMAELRIDFDPESREFGNDSFSHKLVTAWRELSDDSRGQIVGFALVQAATLPSNGPKKDDDSQEEPTGS